MPLLITPAAPLLTLSAVELPSLYAIIDSVSYARKGVFPKRIEAHVGYYANAAASLSAEPIIMPSLPTDFFQDATPEQANTLPIFDFLEGLLVTLLTAHLPAGTRIERIA